MDTSVMMVNIGWLMHDYSVAITSFIVGWTLFLLSHHASKSLFHSYTELKPALQADWCSRVVSTVNAVVVTYGALKVMATSDFDTYPLTAWNDLGGVYIQILLGYFVYDSLLILAYKELRTRGTVLHHALGLLNYSIVYDSKQEQYLAMLWMATELTTPFSHTKVYIINGLAMTLSFLLWRVIYIPAKAFYTFYYFSDQFALLRPYMKLSVLSIPLITLLNVYWTYLMIRGILSVLRRGKKRQKRDEGSGEVVGVHASAVAYPHGHEGKLRRRGA